MAIGVRLEVAGGERCGARGGWWREVWGRRWQVERGVGLEMAGSERCVAECGSWQVSWG